jgi:hypothetical protein
MPLFQQSAPGFVQEQTVGLKSIADPDPLEDSVGKREKPGKKINSRQGGLAALKSDRKPISGRHISPNGIQYFFSRLQGHYAIGTNSAAVCNIGIKTVTTAHITQAGSWFDKQ